MLEQFKVSHDDAIFARGDDLRGAVSEVFEKMGVPPDDASLAADVLVLADLRGVDSHGVSNMLRSYIDGYPRRLDQSAPGLEDHPGDPQHRPPWIPTGGWARSLLPRPWTSPSGRPRPLVSAWWPLATPATWGWRRTTRCWALEHDMIGVCMTSCPPSMLPTFGAEPRLGTNPIAVAVPTNNEAPFVYDAATSSVAVNKIRIAQRLGADIPARLAGQPRRRPHHGGRTGPQTTIGSCRWAATGSWAPTKGTACPAWSTSWPGC